MDDPSFQDLITSLEPRYNLVSRTTITTRLQKRYNDLKAQLTSLLLTIFTCAITHDGWTSIAMQSYCAITVHFITRDWKLKNLCLEVNELQGKHTAENLRQSLLEAQRTWKFPDPIAVTDNAANEVKTFSLLNWPRISCFGHNLNLAVKAALNVKEMDTILEKFRKLINYFHKSAIATRVFKEKQLQLFPDKPARKLERDVPTRWNSTYDMLVRICDLTPALHAALSEQTLKSSNTKFLFTFDDQQLVESVLKILKPFYDATLMMSKEESPSLPTMYPTYLKLLQALNIDEDDNNCIQQMKTQARANLEKRYEEIPRTALIASFLHPRTKHLKFLSQEQRAEIHETVKLQLNMLNNDDVTSEQSSDAKKPRLEENNELDWLDDIVLPTSQNDTEVIATKSEVEFMHYIAEPDTKEEPLMWWKTMEPVFPLLSKLARKYLCVPASSVPSERIFSTAGYLVNRHRASLSADTVDMLLFLHKNMDKI